MGVGIRVGVRVSVRVRVRVRVRAWVRARVRARVRANISPNPNPNPNLNPNPNPNPNPNQAHESEAALRDELQASASRLRELHAAKAATHGALDDSRLRLSDLVRIRVRVS